MSILTLTMLVIIACALVLLSIPVGELAGPVLDAVAVPAAILALVASLLAVCAYVYGLWTITGRVARTSPIGRRSALAARWSPVAALAAPFVALPFGLAGFALAWLAMMALVAVHYVGLRLTIRHLAGRCEKHIEVPLGIWWLVLFVVLVLLGVLIVPLLLAAVLYPVSMIDIVEGVRADVRREIEQVAL